MVYYFIGRSVNKLVSRLYFQKKKKGKKKRKESHDKEHKLKKFYKGFLTFLTEQIPLNI